MTIDLDEIERLARAAERELTLYAPNTPPPDSGPMREFVTALNYETVLELVRLARLGRRAEIIDAASPDHRSLATYSLEELEKMSLRHQSEPNGPAPAQETAADDKHDQDDHDPPGRR